MWWWFENSRACLYYLLVNYCQFIACLACCRVPERWLNGGEVLWDVLSLKNVSSFSYFLEPFVGSSLNFFVEGSILAQDERWRRA